MELSSEAAQAAEAPTPDASFLLLEDGLHTYLGYFYPCPFQGNRAEEPMLAVSISGPWLESEFGEGKHGRAS